MTPSTHSLTRIRRLISSSETVDIPSRCRFAAQVAQRSGRVVERRRPVASDQVAYWRCPLPFPRPTTSPPRAPNPRIACGAITLARMPGRMPSVARLQERPDMAPVGGRWLTAPDLVRSTPSDELRCTSVEVALTPGRTVLAAMSAIGTPVPGCADLRRRAHTQFGKGGPAIG